MTGIDSSGGRDDAVRGDLAARRGARLAEAHLAVLARELVDLDLAPVGEPQRERERRQRRRLLVGVAGVRRPRPAVARAWRRRRTGGAGVASAVAGAPTTGRLASAGETTWAAGACRRAPVVTSRKRTRSPARCRPTTVSSRPSARVRITGMEASGGETTRSAATWRRAPVAGFAEAHAIVLARELVHADLAPVRQLQDERKRRQRLRLHERLRAGVGRGREREGEERPALHPRSELRVPRELHVGQADAADLAGGRSAGPRAPRSRWIPPRR